MPGKRAATIIRISAGEFRHRTIECPQTGGVRPMLSRTRMALFNVLADDVKGAQIWDCFAGTGLLGLDALSRGAAHVVFCERDAGHARVMRENIKGLGAQEGSTVIKGSIFDLIRANTPRLPHTPAGIVLLDPPHAMIEDLDSGPFWPWLMTLHQTPLVDGYTILCVGHSADLEFPAEIGAFRVADQRVYGSVAFSILVRIAPPDEET